MQLALSVHASYQAQVSDPQQVQSQLCMRWCRCQVAQDQAFSFCTLSDTVAKGLISVYVLILSIAALGEDATAIGIDQLGKKPLKPLIHILLMKTDCN